MGRTLVTIASIVAFFLILTSGSICVPEKLPGTAEPVERQQVVLTAYNYTPHLPIIITSNDDFLSQGWPGNGTEANPYLIEGLNITDMSICISISGTTAHFEIRKCLLSAPSTLGFGGIQFDSVTNGVINDSIAEFHDAGVRLIDCGRCILTNSTVRVNGCGFYLVSSSNCTLANNNAAHNWGDGFLLHNSGNCNLTNNVADSNDPASGFYLYNSSDCVLKNNAATGQVHGFFLDDSDGCDLTNSTAAGNSQYGFYLKESTESELESDIAILNGIDGFHLYNSSNCILANSTSSNQVLGFSLDYSGDSTLTNNTAAGNDVGMYLHLSDSCTLTNTTAIDNARYGIYIVGSCDCVLTYNALDGKGVALDGTNVDYWLHDMSDNTVIGKPLGYFRSVSDLSIDAAEYGQVILANCSRVTVSDRPFIDVSPGVLLGFCTSCVLTNNTSVSIELKSCTSCSLMNNTARSYDRHGFYLYRSDNCNLTDNIAADNDDYGFLLEESSICTLTNNTAKGNLYGFNLWNVNRCILTNNTAIVGYAGGGFDLFGSNCTLRNNHAIGDGVHGFDLNGCFDCHLVNNTASGSPASHFWLDFSRNCTLANNTALGSAYNGFRLYESSYCSLTNNTVDGDATAFFLLSSNGCSLTGNTATNNERGVILYNSVGATMTGNTLDGSGIFVQGEFLEYWLHEASGNTVNGKPLGYFKSVKQLSINGYEYGQMILVNCSDVTVRNGTFMDVSYGVQLGFCSDCILMDNTARYNEIGFILFQSSNCTLTSNTAEANWHSGFSLFTTRNCTLTNNTAINNGYGVEIADGSDDNRIFLNRFGYNNYSNADDRGSSNRWDNGTHGNYWSDYVGEGTYTVPGDAWSVDHHPFILDWVAPTIYGPADINYAEGATGHSLEWSFSDTHPHSYAVFLDGSLTKSGAWNTSSEIVTISADGLTVGTHNFTIVMTDVSLNTAVDTVLVTVVDGTAPVIDSPDDIMYSEGITGHTITWNPADAHPASYELYKDSVLLQSGNWDGTAITVTVDGLAVGIYEYRITVTDVGGNNVTDTVMVTVAAATTTTTTTPDNTMVIAAIVGVSVVAVVIVLLLLRKRK